MAIRVRKSVIFGAVALVLAWNSFSVVEFGSVGVAETFGELSGSSLLPGAHPKLPFIQKIVSVNSKPEKIELMVKVSAKDASATVHAMVSYRIDEKRASLLLSEIGPDYANAAVAPAIQSVVKAAASSYASDQLYSKPESFAAEVKEKLSPKLDDSYIQVSDFTVVGIEFPQAFLDSLEARQAAESNLEKTLIETRTQLERAKAEADSMRAKREVVTDALVRLKEAEVQEEAIRKWDGKLPQATGANPFFNISPSSHQAPAAPQAPASPAK